MRLTILLLFVTSFCFSQKMPQVPKIDLKIQVIEDSLVLQLFNQSNRDIKYSQASPFLPAQRLKQGNLYYLQREMEGCYFYFYPEGSLLTNTEDLTQTLHANSSVVYKRNFKNFFPFSLEKGDYKLLLLLEYKYNNEIFSAESNWIDFKFF